MLGAGVYLLSALAFLASPPSPAQEPPGGGGRSGVEAILESARRALQAGDNAAARENFERAEALSSDGPPHQRGEALLGLATLAMKGGDLVGAVRLLEGAIDAWAMVPGSGPQTLWMLDTPAGVHMQNGDALAAERTLARLRDAQTKADPSAPQLAETLEAQASRLGLSALRRQSRSAGQYLIEWRPMHVVVSGTVYAELKKSRRQGTAAPQRLVAFGDPVYPKLSGESVDRLSDVEVRSLVRRGAALAPLLYTRREVESIAQLYADASHAYLGSEATEQRAKSAGKDARILHFATHGLLDERFPLNSALALTIPDVVREGEDNGLLQAWEIFEGLRIDADLVVLSACETGLGKEMGGEGLVGLTRAFQYAGARTVAASLWSVADESTATLMKVLYGYLRSGGTKDEALRMAQVALMRNPRTAHPFHWAAFQIIGDWR